MRYQWVCYCFWVPLINLQKWDLLQHWNSQPLLIFLDLYSTRVLNIWLNCWIFKKKKEEADLKHSTATQQQLPRYTCINAEFAHSCISSFIIFSERGFFCTNKGNFYHRISQSDNDSERVCLCDSLLCWSFAAWFASAEMAGTHSSTSSFTQGWRLGSSLEASIRSIYLMSVKLWVVFLLSSSEWFPRAEIVFSELLVEWIQLWGHC